MFYYPQFDKDGAKVLTRMDSKCPSMLMDITVYQLNQGDVLELLEPDKEIAVLLVSGSLHYKADSIDSKATRENWYSVLPYCLHCPKNTPINVECLSDDTEVILQMTSNDRLFPSKLYTPSDITSFVSCDGMWENTAVRDVVTVFDYSNAPYSNMVVGEVYARQGRWWSYIPHNHPQPEVYYYKFKRPEGFGACFIGDKAYTIKDGSYGCFDGGLNHPQVTAPGYEMYCCWMIRHLDGDPWTTRVDDPHYTHLLNK